MAFDRNKFRQGLDKATQRSSDTIDDRGGFHSYVKKGRRPRYTKIPEGAFIFDIIPYIVENDFQDKDHNYTAGSLQYNLDLWVHQNVGVNNDQVVCLTKTFGRPCPICEERAKREAQGATFDELKVFNPKRRCLYNIWIHDTARSEENKGVQILEIAHFTLERNLINIAKHPITGKLTQFADPDNGKLICFTRKGTGVKNTTYEGHQLLERQINPIPDQILEQSEDLTQLVEIPTYEDVYRMFYGVPTTESAYSPQPSQAPTPAPSAVQQPMYGSEQRGYADVPPWEDPVPAPTTTPTPSQYVAPSPTTGTPPTTAPNFTYANAAPRSEHMTPTPAATTKECPVANYGGKFGETLDKFPQCAGCPDWDACALAFDANH